MEVEGGRYFVKASVQKRAVPSWRRAEALHRSVTHEAIIPLLKTITTDDGLALVYPWVEGEVLYGAPLGGAGARLDPGGPHARFRSLPTSEVLAALESIFGAHLAVADAGFFVVDADRLPGSRRFMAPEEFERGAVIDERTTVFNLGRAALVLLDEGDLDGRFRATSAASDMLGRATHPRRAARYPTVAEFVSAWRAAISG